MPTVQQAIEQALTANAGKPVDVQAAAVAEAIPGPTGNDVGWLWKALIAGLLAALVLSLGGVLVAVLDGKDSTSPDVIVTLFTAVLTGLIGLFVKSPVQG